MEKRKLTNEEISNVCRETALLLHSGIMAADALNMLGGDETEPAVKSMLDSASAKMDDGASLSRALEETGQLPKYATRLLDVGEQSGKLEETLNALSDYYDDRVRMERRIRSAVMYPAILMLIMLIVIIVLLSRVLPVFDQVYRDLGSGLTGVAGGLLSLGKALDSAMPVLCILLGIIVLGLAAFSAVPSFREKILSFWRKRFGDSGISRKLNEAHFAQAFSMGYSSGLPVENAVSLAASLLEETPAAKKRCDDCLGSMDDGMELSKAMKVSGVMPVNECRLLELGLKSGSGDRVTAQIADRLSERADNAVEEFVGQIEPALVLCSSVLVGVILLSVMLPLMNIMTAIG